MRLLFWNSQKPSYPLAEKYPGVSSYTYCINNPVNLVDPDGMVATPPGDFINEKGKLGKWMDETGASAYKVGNNYALSDVLQIKEYSIQ